MSDEESCELDVAIVPGLLEQEVKDSLQGHLIKIGGSRSDHWNTMIIDQIAGSLWRGNSDAREREAQLSATFAAMMGIAPKDELEGMLGAQLVAAHNAAMECYRRAMIGDQSIEMRQLNLAQANKLSRTYAGLLEALNRHRGKGQQKVTVEHVHVHAGGQAVVGVVEPAGGGGAARIEDKPHAKTIAHASEPALPCSNPQRDALPIACDEKRALPSSRRKGNRRSQG
jgi:hypothetical protein